MRQGEKKHLLRKNEKGLELQLASETKWKMVSGDVFKPKGNNHMFPNTGADDGTSVLCFSCLRHIDRIKADVCAVFKATLDGELCTWRGPDPMGSAER